MGDKMNFIQIGFLIDSGLHLYLPLVFFNAACLSDVPDKAGEVVAVSAKYVFICLRSYAFHASARGNNRPSVSYTRQSGYQSFDALIKSGVQGIAPATGDNHIRFRIDDRTGLLACIIARVVMAFKKVSGKNLHDLFFPVHDNLDAEIDAGQPGYGQRLFMAGISCELSGNDAGVGEEFIPVKVLDRFQGGKAGAECFASAGKPRHKMRFDKSDDDFIIRLGKKSVQFYRGPGVACPRKVGHVAFSIVIHNGIVFGNLFTEHEEPLFRRTGPVHAGGNQNGNPFPVYSRGCDFMKQSRQKSPVGNRSGNIRNRNDNIVTRSLL